MDNFISCIKTLKACNLKHVLVGVSSKRQSLNECVFMLVQAKSTKIPNKRQTT